MKRNTIAQGVLILFFVFALPAGTAWADFGAPPGGPPGGPIGGGNSSTTTTIHSSGSSGGINVGAAVGGAAACAVVSAIFDPSVVDVRTFAKYSVVPCVVATGAVILVSLAGGPAAVGVIVGMVVYGVIRWFVGLFESGPDTPESARRISNVVANPFACDVTQTYDHGYCDRGR